MTWHGENHCSLQKGSDFPDLTNCGKISLSFDLFENLSKYLRSARSTAGPSASGDALQELHDLNDNQCIIVVQHSESYLCNQCNIVARGNGIAVFTIGPIRGDSHVNL